MAVAKSRPGARELVSDAAIAAAPAPEAARKLRLLRSVFDPTEPVDLQTVPGDSAFLSDATWTDAKWVGDKLREIIFRSTGTFRIWSCCTLGGQIFDKGLYAHSPARYVFPVAGKWKTFTATIGLRDGAAIQGSAIFTVRGDGKELYRSNMLRVGSAPK